MKKWTIMLIPHDRSHTRTLEMRSYQVWLAAWLCAVVCFTSGFLYQQWRVNRRTVRQLQKQIRVLEIEEVDQAHATREGVSREELAQIERRIREEYESRQAAIASELVELYETEAEIRRIHGLPPRPSLGAGRAATGVGGKGGGPDELDETVTSDEDAMVLPPQFIYGLSEPSGDLIIQEINLRTESLKALLQDMVLEQDRIEHTPAIWPVGDVDRYISSKYGNRRDPFDGKRIRFHHGIDIVAPYRTPVLATAKGVVKSVGYDRHMGNTVVVDHGYDIETRYAHLRKSLVKKGESIERGQPVGSLGNSGERSTGAHLHYEVRCNGNSVNPLKYLGN